MHHGYRLQPTEQHGIAKRQWPGDGHAAGVWQSQRSFTGTPQTNQAPSQPSEATSKTGESVQLEPWEAQQLQVTDKLRDLPSVDKERVSTPQTSRKRWQLSGR